MLDRRHYFIELAPRRADWHSRIADAETGEPVGTARRADPGTARWTRLVPLVGPSRPTLEVVEPPDGSLVFVIQPHGRGLNVFDGLHQPVWQCRVTADNGYAVLTAARRTVAVVRVQSGRAFAVESITGAVLAEGDFSPRGVTVLTRPALDGRPFERMLALAAGYWLTVLHPSAFRS